MRNKDEVSKHPGKRRVLTFKILALTGYIWICPSEELKELERDFPKNPIRFAEG